MSLGVFAPFFPTDWFDTDFDKEVSDDCIKFVQQIGCFFCRATASYKCRNCKIAKYCGSACQKADWKKCHRENCLTYCTNIKEGGFSIPISLYSGNFICEHTMILAMRERCRCFMKMVASSETMIEKLSFKLAVLIERKARFSVSVNGFVLVPHVYTEMVDEGDEALARLRLGNGHLSLEAKRNVISHSIIFGKMLLETGKIEIDTTMFQLGRGIVDWLDEFHDIMYKNGITAIIVDAQSLD